MHCGGGGRRCRLVGPDIRPDGVSNADWRKIPRTPLEEEELRHIPWEALAAAANARSSGSYHPSLIAAA
jgi:hypothetical protein